MSPTTRPAPPREVSHGGAPRPGERRLARRVGHSVRAFATWLNVELDRLRPGTEPPPGGPLARTLARFGYRLRPPYPPDFSPELIDTIEAVEYATMTSRERIAAVCDAAGYVTRNGIDGAWVECGVWRGGSTMAAALTFKRLGDTERDLFLCDTFTGMTAPTPADAGIDHDAEATRRFWEQSLRPDGTSEWTLATLADVEANMRRTGYPPERIHLVKGPVEETLPAGAPEQIAILRLDTDWYESTRHELETLEPRLVTGGVLIVDDYGQWSGARQAVDEYFAERPILLGRIDYTGRIAIKQW